MYIYDNVCWKVYEWDTIDSLYILIDVIPFSRAKISYADILHLHDPYEKEVDLITKQINKVGIHSREI